MSTQRYKDEIAATVAAPRSASGDIPVSRDLVIAVRAYVQAKRDKQDAMGLDHGATDLLLSRIDSALATADRTGSGRYTDKSERKADAWRERNEGGIAPSAVLPSELRWRTHEEKPNTLEPVTALLMIPDVEGEPYQPMIAGVYLWRGGQWTSEDTGKPCSTPFWWVLEDEIAATVAAPRSARMAAT